MSRLGVWCTDGPSLATTGDPPRGLPPSGLMPPPDILVHSSPDWAFYWLSWSEPVPTTDQLSRERWKLRLTGDPAVAIRDLRCTAYWSGTMTLRVR